MPVHHLVDDDLMRNVLGAEDDFRDLVNLNDIGHLREVADEAFRGLPLWLRTHQTDEIGFDGGTLQNGVDPLRFLWTANDEEAFLLRLLRLEVLVAQQNADKTCEAHLQGKP